MRPKRWLRLLLALGFAVVTAVGLSACNTQRVAPTSDTYTCIYGPEKNGQHLVEQLPPGSNAIDVNDEDQVIKIPTSNRFFMATFDESLRDPLAPEFYPGYARNSVEVRIEGQVRFRFNQPKICEWYAKHGRRNADSEGDLGFNSRNKAEAEKAGWFHFLAENFGLTMDGTVTHVVNNYEWAAMTFNYPVNADESGIVPNGQKPGEDTHTRLGRELGEQFTKELEANLGGQYFCGIEVVPGDPCPPMSFQVKQVTPVNHTLLTDRQKFETTKQVVQNNEAEGELLSQQRASAVKSAHAREEVIREELATADLEAELNFAPCAPYVRNGLDCSSEHKPLPVGRGNITITGH